jgi:hypothetical protein
MGYNATWAPSNADFLNTEFDTDEFVTNQPIPGKVLYNGPTEREKLFDANYDPEKLNMEYKDGVFRGLKESIDSGTAETVTIENIGTFRVRGVQKLFDGKNYKATLIKVN